MLNKNIGDLDMSERDRDTALFKLPRVRTGFELHKEYKSFKKFRKIQSFHVQNENAN